MAPKAFAKIAPLPSLPSLLPFCQRASELTFFLLLLLFGLGAPATAAAEGGGRGKQIAFNGIF